MNHPIANQFALKKRVFHFDAASTIIDVTAAQKTAKKVK
jgi:hypothetical protein